MDLTPEDRQRIYAEEKARLEAQRDIKKERSGKWRSGCLWALLALVVLVIISGIAQRVSPSRREREAAQMNTAPSEPMLELVDFNWSIESNYAILEGQVRNISAQSLGRVSALATFYDKSGGFITSNYSVIEFDPILPGQVSPFKVMARANPAMVKAGVEFKYLMGGSIPSRDGRKKK